ncbi:hypothetical protein ABPG74_018577 [Tetrahymena malaccensis]
MKFLALLLVSLLASSVLCDDCNPTITPCSPACQAAGFLQGTDANKSCLAPTDCTTGSQCGGDKLKQACIDVGFQNNNNVCVAPTDTQCLSVSAMLCKYPISQCITVNGFTPVKDASNCTEPTDCQAQNAGLCGTGRTYCISQGFTKKSDSNDCTCDTSKNTLQNNTCKAKSGSLILVASSVFMIIAALLF